MWNTTITLAVISLGTPGNEMGRQWVWHPHDNPEYRHLRGTVTHWLTLPGIFISVLAPRLCWELGLCSGSTGHPGCCIFPGQHQRFLDLGAIVWKIDYDAQSSLAFLKINTFWSCDQRLAQAVLLLSINFHCLWKLASLGAPNISSSSLHLPLVNLPKMSFQRTKLQHTRGDEKLLFTSYCLAKVSL